MKDDGHGRIVVVNENGILWIMDGNMRRCVIIGGADIGDYEAARSYFRPDDFIICCDSGSRHRNGLKVTPDLIIGDFDSSEKPDLDVEMITLPREKDDTDTVAAARAAIDRGFEDFLLLGVFGGRMDHTLANVYLLLWLDDHGRKVCAVDDYSEFEIISPDSPGYIGNRYPYFSIVAISGSAEGITIRNAKYTLEDGVINPGYQYGVSNEPLPENVAEVSLKKGSLLLIKDKV